MRSQCFDQVFKTDHTFNTLQSHSFTCMYIFLITITFLTDATFAQQATPIRQPGYSCTTH